MYSTDILFFTLSVAVILYVIVSFTSKEPDTVSTLNNNSLPKLSNTWNKAYGLSPF